MAATWTPEKKEQAITDILEHVSSGGSVNSIIKNSCRTVIPSYPTFCEWLNEDEQLAKRYARACEVRADTIFEEILDIADDKSNDTISTDNGDIPNSEWINRSRLRIDARKWMAGKMAPKKYGDKSTHILEGGDVPIKISFKDNAD